MRAAAVLLAVGGVIWAQPVPRPALGETRSDEDWSFLKDPAKRADYWDFAKYVGLRCEGCYLSFGGEVRIRYELFRNAGFGSAPETPHGFLIQRYLFHADTHLGPHLRLFTQFQSGVEHGRIGGPRATDKDTAEVHQGFLDVITARDPKKAVTIRLGRQELEFGAGHYLSASEVFNVRRTFDGVRLFGLMRGWTWNLVAARPVETNPEAFDDSPDHRQRLWAGGIFGPSPLFKGGNMSVYYINFDRKSGRFNQGAARETRHTAGTRHWGRFRGWDYNEELLVQWGNFGAGSIRAWAIATDTGYSWPKKRFIPRMGVRGNASSGDRDPREADLQSFNPLFPTTAYSGRIGLIGASNVMDVTPNVRLRFHRRVFFLPEASFFWRQSLRDGIYGVLGTPQRSGQLSGERYIGAQLSLPVLIQIGRHTTFAALISRFWAGPYLKQSPPGRSVTYFTTFLAYRF